jgi:Ca2+-binding EF-hand superfamily protein
MANFSASSLFAGVNAGVRNSYAVLSNMYSDGLTQKNLSKAMTDPNFLANQYGTTFASYLSQNFATLDKNHNGKLSGKEVDKLMNQISNRGLTREQVSSSGGMSGMSANAQSTVLDHFNDIDTNHDGYVSSAEVQAYILQSKIENRKHSDTNKMINKTSIFYGDDKKDDDSTSLLSYKWLQEDNNSK